MGDPMLGCLPFLCGNTSVLVSKDSLEMATFNARKTNYPYAMQTFSPVSCFWPPLREKAFSCLPAKRFLDSCHFREQHSSTGKAAILKVNEL